ncbi:hypothetical protein SEA_COOG_25 [Mycobacterium phage Coog]|nr:hypothetical protein SEA_COOG_25 [Mycobacterium phage Coog]AVR77156.1 hypothetical protein SEA_MIDAS2_25 [Mycobacterium phage Midas2]
MGIATQETTNWKDPEEHFLWALQNLPTIAGFGAITNPLFLKAWSKHLWECGFAHRDYLVSLADEDGNINISQLPEQIKKFQLPFRGERHAYNNASRWVTPDTPEPTKPVIQDVRKLALNEQEAVKQMLIETGVVKEEKPQPPMAQVIIEESSHE